MIETPKGFNKLEGADTVNGAFYEEDSAFNKNIDKTEELFEGKVSKTGDTLTGGLVFNGTSRSISSILNGASWNTISRIDNNIWIGDAADAGGVQGNVFLATSANGNAYVSRNNIRTQILDYGFCGKILFSGSWSSGSVTVPGINNYKEFLIVYSGLATGAIATRIASYIRGWGANPNAGGTTSYSFSASVSGENLTLGFAGSMSHNGGSTNGTPNNLTVEQIIGII